MMKYFSKVMIPSLLAVLFLFITQVTPANAAIDNKPGDIIITNDTSAKGVTGHTGIYIDSKNILHTSGRNGEPYPFVLSESEWHARYKRSKVIRPKSSSLGQAAANNAVKYFKGKKISYSITPNPKDISYVYCSELVWYSYYKAGKSFKTMFTTASQSYYKVPNIIAPYDFIHTSYVNYNGFKFIDNTW